MKHACESVSQLASEQLERKLSFKERFLMKFHFLMCGACRQYGKNLLLLDQVLNRRRASENAAIKLPDDKRKAIQSVVKQLPRSNING